MTRQPANSLEIEVFEPDRVSVLVQQMSDALERVRDLPTPDLSEIHQRASITEAAAKKGRSQSVQLAAAELRLHAERRLGELILSGIKVDGFTPSEVKDFTRLAMIPRSHRVAAAESLGIRPRIADLFVESVEDQLQVRRSQTAYSVYMTSLHISAKIHPQYGWLSQTWDDTWVFRYQDPRTKRWRQEMIRGTLDHVLEARAVACGRISSSSTKLLPIRARNALTVPLEHIRLARESLGECWNGLSRAQKEELDGAYSNLDDLALSVVRAVNL